MSGNQLHLDTHVVVWLYSGNLSHFSAQGLDKIDTSELIYSPMVELELKYLHEIERLTHSSSQILHDLTSRIDLQVCNASLEEIVRTSLSLSWTRDPFDRLITATAQLQNCELLTKDAKILSNFSLATW